MNTSLVKEIPFGKAIAKITVSRFTEMGVFLNENIVETAKVEIVVDNKIIETAPFAKIMEYNFLTDSFFKQHNLNINKKYTKVGDKAIIEGEEIGLAIKNAIDELRAELSKPLNVETEVTHQAQDEIVTAQAIVSQAKKESIDKLLTEIEIKAWRKNYNNVVNEGGEGYIPSRISKKAYQKALKILENVVD